MIEGITILALSIVFLIIGILNLKGNISTLHSYHINNVTEEDKPKLGKFVGISMLIIAFSFIVSGILFILADKLSKETLAIIATIFLIICVSISSTITLCAIKKYNKKIFG